MVHSHCTIFHKFPGELQFIPIQKALPFYEVQDRLKVSRQFLTISSDSPYYFAEESIPHSAVDINWMLHCKQQAAQSWHIAKDILIRQQLNFKS